MTKVNRIKAAIAGVGMSAAALAGAYAADHMSSTAEHEAKVECYVQLEGDEQKDCLNDAEAMLSPNYSGILKLAGEVGIIGFGYLGYKAVKEQSDTTGIIDDVMG